MYGYFSSEMPSPMDAAHLVEVDHLSDVDPDVQLLNGLRQLHYQHEPVLASTGESYLNAAVADRIRPSYSAEQLDDLEAELDTHGALAIPTARGAVTVDGITHIVPFVAATETDANHGEMSSMLYLRDHIQTSRSYMEKYLHDPSRYEAEGTMGRDLLQSALLLMSTPSQLDRFEHVISIGHEAGQADWPQISLYFDDLEGHKPNGWRNKQDTWQMLGHLTFDAIERGFIDETDLTERNKQFLGYLVPFLMAAGYPTYENSGSWEEITAVRSSVMAVETALLHKIQQQLSADDPQQPKYGFLQEAYAKYRPEGTPEHLKDALSVLLNEGLTALGQRLPNESGGLDHDPGSVKYREADAALTYVLMYDLPQLLADNHAPIGANGDIMTANEIENMILAQLDTLMDPPTGGMKRYTGDSYQRTNFHTYATQTEIAKIKQAIKETAARTGAEPDLDEKQRRRNEAVMAGREAAWTHPVSQLAAWAAKRSIHAGDSAESRRYRALGTKFLNQSLRLVTGEGQYTAALQADGTYQIVRLPAYRLPECFITYQDELGEMRFPSPHSPLNWSTAMLGEAIALYGASVRTSTSPARSLGAYCLGTEQTDR